MFALSSIDEGKYIKILTKDESNTLREFLKIKIPDYINNYEGAEFDLMDCYEVGFTFANALLRGEKINPQASPWGDGNSVIFDSNYAELLSGIQSSSSDKDISNYCRVYLEVLEIFKSHFA